MTCDDFKIGITSRGKKRNARKKKQDDGAENEGKRKDPRRTELITHFRLLKSERDEVAGADGRQYRFICRPTARERRSKSLFRIARMNIYDRTSGRATRRREREEETGEKDAAKSGGSGSTTPARWRIKKRVGIRIPLIYSVVIFTLKMYRLNAGS